MHATIRMGETFGTVEYPFGTWDMVFGLIAQPREEAICQLVIEDGTNLVNPPLLKGTRLEIKSTKDTPYDAFRHLGFLVSCVHKDYYFCSASGFDYFGKGILLVGPSGYGKSTLTWNLIGGLDGHMNVISDDTLLIVDNRMVKIGLSSLTFPDKKQGIALYPSKIDKLNIDYLFFLDHEMPPEESYATQMAIRPEHSFDYSIHPNLFRYHAEKGALDLQVPKYVLGTNGNLRLSIAIIKRIVGRL